uniref:FBA_2 domain-containing protein n=1 Tax=Caenorhabditis tropicalis TaxID=1561998 RepID=A0A1I7TAI1_9PELO
MQSLRHQNVYFPSYSIHFLDSEDFILLIRNWVETNKPIGTCFTFSLNSEDNIAILILNRVKERLENATAGKKCINIPMRTSAILNISYFRDTATRLYLRMTVVQSSKLGIKIT